MPASGGAGQISQRGRGIIPLFACFNQKGVAFAGQAPGFSLIPPVQATPGIAALPGAGVFLARKATPLYR